MGYRDGDIFDTELSLSPNCTKVRIIGGETAIKGAKDKFWMKGIPVCEEAAQPDADGRQCNGCTYRCGQKPVFIKFYTGQEEEIIKSMRNQGNSCILSPYIAKTYGFGHTDFGCFVVMEYADGRSLEELPFVLRQQSRVMPDARASLLIKYKIMRQILVCVRDYQKQRFGGYGVHLDLKPENFLLVQKGNLDCLQIKLVDFEGYTRTDDAMSTFVSSAGYAHPMQLNCFLHGQAPIQVEVTWDFYALGIIFYEILEEHPFYTEEEIRLRKEEPLKVKKEMVFKKYPKDVSEGEASYVKYMLEKMMDLEAPWESIDEIIFYFEEMLRKCLTFSETLQIQGKEFLKADENALLQKPCLHISIKICAEGYPDVYQSYDLIQGSAIPWYYGINICGTEEYERGELLGYLYECQGEAYYFPIKEEEQGEKFTDALSKEDVITYGNMEIVLIKIEKTGYEKKKRTGGIRNI